ncbi:MAG: LytR/AlgR family response regulator transcription factor [Oliverpabstia sp.]|nr:LytTR family DNA-binding domain-containing protein [Lachnospiraceae bacterium]MDY5026084.1 LytTR family DNA-binding domain-containing protein [Oliverpabstia sp.]
MLNIAICDDDALILSKVEELVGVFFRTHCIEMKMQSYQLSENLTYDLQDGLYYDLFLLDIEMPGIDGRELAKSIHNNMPAAKVIFITSHLEYAVEAYEFSIFRYIPKTAIEEKLSAALNDFYKLYRLERNEFYTIQVKNYVEQLSYRDILYILKEGKYAVFHLANGRTNSVRKTLAQVFKEINKDYFYFADRGCIVNLANVIGMNENGILFSDNQRLAISKASISDFKTILLRFWGKQI